MAAKVVERVISQRIDARRGGVGQQPESAGNRHDDAEPKINAVDDVVNVNGFAAERFVQDIPAADQPNDAASRGGFSEVDGHGRVGSVNAARIGSRRGGPMGLLQEAAQPHLVLAADAGRRRGDATPTAPAVGMH